MSFLHHIGTDLQQHIIEQVAMLRINPSVQTTSPAVNSALYDLRVFSATLVVVSTAALESDVSFLELESPARVGLAVISISVRFIMLQL